MVAAVTLAALVLSGCSSIADELADRASQPPALQPLPTSTVAQGTLPPIGQDGRVTVAQPGMVNPNLTGQPTTTGRHDDPGAADADRRRRPGARPPPTTAGFVTLDSVGSVPAQPGRDLTGGLSEAKLLGGWTVVSGPTQCRLNLTQTAKARHATATAPRPRAASSPASPPFPRGSSRAARSSCSTRTTTWSRR